MIVTEGWAALRCKTCGGPVGRAVPIGSAPVVVRWALKEHRFCVLTVARVPAPTTCTS